MKFLLHLLILGCLSASLLVALPTCSTCADYLNEVQCNAVIDSACHWTNVTNSCIEYNCASRNDSTACAYYDGQDSTKPCYWDGAACVAADPTLPCAEYATDAQCNLFPVHCVWSGAACRDPECADISDLSVCPSRLTRKVPLAQFYCKVQGGACVDAAPQDFDADAAACIAYDGLTYDAANATCGECGGADGSPCTCTSLRNEEQCVLGTVDSKCKWSNETQACAELRCADKYNPDDASSCTGTDGSDYTAKCFRNGTQCLAADRSWPCANYTQSVCTKYAGCFWDNANYLCRDAVCADMSPAWRCQNRFQRHASGEYFYCRYNTTCTEVTPAELSNTTCNGYAGLTFNNASGVCQECPVPAGDSPLASTTNTTDNMNSTVNASVGKGATRLAPLLVLVLLIYS